MKNISFLLLLFSFLAAAQEKPVYEGPVYAQKELDKPAVYGGNPTGILSYFQKQFVVPQAPVAQLDLALAFIVEVDGTISGIEIIKDDGFGGAQEGVRVLREFPGGYTPGEKNGRKVRSRFVFPVKIAVGAGNVQQSERVYLLSEVDTPPEYPGGNNVLREWAQKNYPFSAALPAGQHKILISFVIEPDGTMGSFKAEKDPGNGAASSLIKLVAGHKTKWMPAYLAGKPVRCKFFLGLTIVISE